MGYLIVLEGSDCSGKTTQFKLLEKALAERLSSFKSINFPRYENPSSDFLKRYLAGDFGAEPSDVSPYLSSTFFALDRYASYMEDWGMDYRGSTVILSDRYTTSNAIHQGAKVPDPIGFTEWLFDFEYSKLGIPEPDLVIFLNMPFEHSLRLLAARTGKGKDIHENDHVFLEKCYVKSLNVCKRFKWLEIECVRDGFVRSPECIHAEILRMVGGRLPVEYDMNKHNKQ